MITKIIGNKNKNKKLLKIHFIYQKNGKNRQKKNPTKIQNSSNQSKDWKKGDKKE